MLDGCPVARIFEDANSIDVNRLHDLIAEIRRDPYRFASQSDLDKAREAKEQAESNAEYWADEHEKAEGRIEELEAKLAKLSCKTP